MKATRAKRQDPRAQIWARQGDRERIGISVRAEFYRRIMAYCDRMHVKPAHGCQVMLLAGLAKLESFEAEGAPHAHSWGVDFVAEALGSGGDREGGCSDCSLGPCESRGRCGKIVPFRMNA
jgi:hypothetical protein